MIGLNKYKKNLYVAFKMNFNITNHDYNPLIQILCLNKLEINRKNCGYFIQLLIILLIVLVYWRDLNFTSTITFIASYDEFQQDCNVVNDNVNFINCYSHIIVIGMIY